MEKKIDKAQLRRERRADRIESAQIFALGAGLLIFLPVAWLGIALYPLRGIIGTRRQKRHARREAVGK